MVIGVIGCFDTWLASAQSEGMIATKGIELQRVNAGGVHLRYRLRLYSRGHSIFLLSALKMTSLTILPTESRSNCNSVSVVRTKKRELDAANSGLSGVLGSPSQGRLFLREMTMLLSKNLYPPARSRNSANGRNASRGRRARRSAESGRQGRRAFQVESDGRSSSRPQKEQWAVR